MVPTGLVQLLSKGSENSHIIQEILLVLDHLTHPRGFGQLILCSDVGGRSPTLFAVDAAKIALLFVTKVVASGAIHLIFLFILYPHKMSITRRNITRNHFYPLHKPEI